MASKNLIYYGLQRSGTNYLASLLKQQFEVEFLNTQNDRSHPGHKHFRIYDNKNLIGRPNYQNDIYINDIEDLESKLDSVNRPDGYIILSKDPYSWLISYKKWARSMKWPAPPHPFIMEYNEFYRKWVELKTTSDKVMLIRYSDLLTNNASTLDLISSAFKLQQKILDRQFDQEIKKVPRSSKFTQKNYSYYSKRQYLKRYSKKELDEINRLIDHDLLKKLGYSSYF